MSVSMTDVGSTTEMMKGILGLTHTMGDTVGMIEMMKDMNTALGESQRKRKAWVNIGIVLSSSTAGMRE
jgi:hypothetical protein